MCSPVAPTEKHIVITGANRGIGRACVQAFAENGYDIWACARKKNEDFEADMAILSKATGAIIEPVYFDLTNEQEVKEGVKHILSEKKNVDVLLNNAGMPYGGPLMTVAMNKLREVYEVNVFAQVLLMQLFARAMVRQKSGCIINMCSIGGIDTHPGYVAYGSSKAALIYLTKMASRELAPHHIRVNGIAPGIIDTDMGHSRTQNELEDVMKRMSIKRMGQPEEIAKAALYIASGDAAFMTGQILILDGGRF